VSNIEKFDSVPHSTHCYLKILWNHAAAIASTN
jgi:hypothetical protein